MQLFAFVVLALMPIYFALISSENEFACSG